MARMPRLYIEGCAQHIVQRGNNRSACFFCEADYAFYLQKLKEASKFYGVKVHAFVLMTNHVHLLLTPNDQYGVSRLMQSLGRAYGKSELNCLKINVPDPLIDSDCRYRST